MSTFPFWIRAARLRTLPLALSCVVIAAFMASYYDSFGWKIFSLSVLTTILLQILANFSNDYGDAINGADNDGRVGPDRMVQSGKITPGQMRMGIIWTSALTIISGLALLYVAFGDKLFSGSVILLFVMGLVSIAAAVKYTAGRNPYGYRGLGDLSVFLFFGLLGVLGNLYLYTHQISMIYLLPALSIGALSVAVLNLNNMRDRIEDEKAGKRTIPVLIGQRASKTYHLMLIGVSIIAAIVFSLMTRRPVYQFIYLLPLIILMMHAAKVIRTEKPQDFDPELKKVALSTFLFALLFGLGLII